MTQTDSRRAFSFFPDGKGARRRTEFLFFVSSFTRVWTTFAPGPPLQKGNGGAFHPEAANAAQTKMEKNRIDWLDALRGFTMILVVSYHVAQNCFLENEKTTAALPFLVLLRMPAFFFVSGFLAYKASFRWTVPAALSLTWKKIKVQTVPAFIFLCVFIVLRKDGFWENFTAFMASPTKGGYWFTWVLLQMFVIYYALCLLSKGRNWPVWILWAVSVAVYETLYMPRVFTYFKAPFFDWSSLVETMKFMQFFLFGNLVHRYWAEAEKIMDGKWFFALAVALLFFCQADFFRWHFLRRMWTNLPRTLSMYLLVSVLVVVFRYYRDWFSGGGAAARALRYTGRRTLDIYLLHFILMPSMPGVGRWLNENSPNFVIDIVLSFSLALVVTAFCLLLSGVLRVSPFLRLWLFGKK